MKCNRCDKPLKPADNAGIRTWLCTSCHDVHGSESAKHAQRVKIRSEVAQFVDSGGEIQTVTYEDNHMYKQPVKRTRKEQIKYHNRRFNTA